MANLNNEFDAQNAELNNNEVDTASDYIAAIQTMKETTVSRDKYNEAIAENRKLIKALTNGDFIATAEPVKKKSLSECRENFKRPSGSQCEYLEKALALREAAIEAGEPDPMVSTGHHIKPTIQNYQRSQEIADIYREILDYANGDDKVLINELQRRMIN